MASLGLSFLICKMEEKSIPPYSLNLSKEKEAMTFLNDTLRRN